MKNKKIIMYVGIVLIVLIILGVGYIVYNNIKNKSKGNEVISEYTPQEEITEEQLRQTVITLYFLEPESLQLIPEARQIDAKELVTNPYEVLVKLLIEGPKNDKLLKLIPENTILNSAQVKDNILYLDFSEEFVKEQSLGKEQEELIVKSIVNTVTELTEINQVAILINGEKDKGFPDGGMIFNKIFVR